MLLLAVDTATALVSAALHDGERVLAEAAASAGRGHAEALAGLVETVLARSGRRRTELTALAAGTGPGPFTGLRVGIVTARVMGLALGVPVHGICTLDALAAQAAAARPQLADGPGFLVATDARRREVYWAGYRSGPDLPRLPGTDVGRVEGPLVGPARQVPRQDRPVVGRGALLYPDDLGPAVEPLDPTAAWVAALAAAAIEAGQEAGDSEPLYLRRPDAAEPAARKPVLR